MATVTEPSNDALIDGNAVAARALHWAGVEKMFGVVGIPVTSLATRAVALGIRFLAFHNEQSAGYAASAYGYLAFKPGVLLTVSGPGCVHGLAGLSNAMANAWPLFMISGSCDQKDFGKGDFQVLKISLIVCEFRSDFGEIDFFMVDFGGGDRRSWIRLRL